MKILDSYNCEKKDKKDRTSTTTTTTEAQQQLQLDARPTGDQEVAGSTPAEVGNILSWR